jgi:HPr kinase/phosphorylase
MERDDRMSTGVKIEELQKQFDLEIVGTNVPLTRAIHTSDLYRPGLELAGFFTYHPVDRLQLLGKTELSFIESLPSDVREDRMKRICNPELPAICITRNLTVPTDLIEAANEVRVSVLRTSMATTKFASVVTDYLEKRLAPVSTLHGVLVDVYGIGVLIIGESGIGKSEAALELIKRGHMLVADDAVQITQVTTGELSGTAPQLIKHLLEIRGLGIMNVMTLFGAGAVRNKKTISLVIRLETWRENYPYDRLGLSEERIRIMDSVLPKLDIPVRPGRNLAVIIEVAAMNYRSKQLGYHAAEQFLSQLEDTLNDDKE